MARLVWGLLLLSALAEVVTLDDTNLHTAVQQHVLILVKFYAPWCGHCQHLAPIYAQAAAMLADEESQVVMAEIDATTQLASANEFDVRAYPTIIFFVSGKPSEHYYGERKAETIVEWLLQKEAQFKQQAAQSPPPS